METIYLQSCTILCSFKPITNVKGVADICFSLSLI